MSTDMDDAVREQVVEATVANIRDSGGFTNFFSPGDAELAGAIEGGKMAMTSTAKGTVTLYDQTTGEPRPGVLINMLSKTLRKKRPDGKPGPALDMKPPEGVAYSGGDTLCWFHPDNPRRKQYDEIGLRGKVCMSAHLASEYDARQHAQNRHNQWFKIANEHEERARQDAMYQAMMKMAEGGTGKRAS